MPRVAAEGGWRWFYESVTRQLAALLALTLQVAGANIFLRVGFIESKQEGDREDDAKRFEVLALG